jgi:hypothetical protein
MAQTNFKSNLKLFKSYCMKSLVSIEILEANQTNFNYDKENILGIICGRHLLTAPVLEWLLINYPCPMLDRYLECILTNLNNRMRSVFPIEEYIILIDYLIKIKGNLYWKKSPTNRTILHWIFSNKLFDVPMLNYLYQSYPQLDIMHKDSLGRSLLFYLIQNSPRLLELLQVIKSYEPTNFITQIRIEWSLNRDVNKYAKDPNQSTICVLIGLCGELFPLIDRKYLTQDISNQFYSSKYFQCNPDQESLIKLIPKQFPRKPCRLWRNQFT